MLAFYTPERMIGGAFALTALCWFLYSSVAPKDTYIYGPDGRWLQDAGHPNKAFDLSHVGRVATFTNENWTDNKGQDVKLGPPPPPGWMQNEKDPFECKGADGKIAKWDGQGKWLGKNGETIWQPSSP